MTYDELYHHGIRGQKWGVRRWQNEDGSLTEAGKKHYKRAYNDISAEYKRVLVNHEDYGPTGRKTAEKLIRGKTEARAKMVDGKSGGMKKIAKGVKESPEYPNAKLAKKMNAAINYGVDNEIDTLTKAMDNVAKTRGKNNKVYKTYKETLNTYKQLKRKIDKGDCKPGRDFALIDSESMGRSIRLKNDRIGVLSRGYGTNSINLGFVSDENLMKRR